MTLGDLIKRRRAELGMTQARLAELVGKSASAVRSWERGRAAPKGESTRAALAAVLGVTDAQLEAAIAGESLSFFSEPGRPVAVDPTPTIVVDPRKGVSAEAESGMMTGDAATSVDPETPSHSDMSARSADDDDADQGERNDEVDPMVSPALDELEVADERVVEDPPQAAQTATAVDEESIENGTPEQDATTADTEAANAEVLDADVAAADVAGTGDSDPVETAVTEDATPATEGIGDDDGDAGSDDTSAAPLTGGLGREPWELPEDDDASQPLLVGAGAAVAATVTRLVPRRRSAAPEAIFAPTPDVEADPVSQDAWLYRRRLIMLTVFFVFLLITLRWALSGVADALGEVMDNLRTGF